jgi:hypothetical protein
MVACYMHSLPSNACRASSVELSAGPCECLSPTCRRSPTCGSLCHHPYLRTNITRKRILCRVDDSDLLLFNLRRQQPTIGARRNNATHPLTPTARRSPIRASPVPRSSQCHPDTSTPWKNTFSRDAPQSGSRLCHFREDPCEHELDIHVFLTYNSVIK